MKVRSIYSNIPNNEDLRAVETTLRLKNLPLRVIISFLKLILTLSSFIFNCINLLKIKGFVMGTKLVSIYAKISMGIFEETHIYPLIETLEP